MNEQFWPYRQWSLLCFSPFASLSIFSVFEVCLPWLAPTQARLPPVIELVCSFFLFIIIIVRLITRARISCSSPLPQFHYQKQIVFTTCCTKHEGHLNTSSYLCANVIRNGCTPLKKKINPVINKQ